MSLWATAAASVKVTVVPLIAKPDCATVSGVVLPEGVFFTVSAFSSSQGACTRPSSKVSTSEVPFTAALTSDGAVMSGSDATNTGDRP